MTVRVAVIGAGIMGADHAAIFAQELRGSALQVVCDISDVTARQVADVCGAIDVSTDAIATIKRDDVDAVVVASPDPTHADLTLRALELRKPVLCEKPLATTATKSLAVVDAESAIGTQLVQVGFMRRFDPSYVEMKTTLLDGQIGSAVMMHNFHRNVTAPVGFSGLMAITNSAPHEFDVVRYVLETEVAAISAFEPALEVEGTCKPVVLILELTSGQLVTIEVNNEANYGYDVRGELIGTKGSISLANPSLIRTDRQLQSGTSYAADWRPRFREAYRLQNNAWLRSIETGVPTTGAANAWDGYCAAAIAEAGTAALSSGKKVAVEIAKKPSLYSEIEVAA